MDIDRAQQIVAAKETINVKFGGESVWIDRVNSSDGTVSIHKLDRPEAAETVPVTQIQEA